MIKRPPDADGRADLPLIPHFKEAPLVHKRGRSRSLSPEFQGFQTRRKNAHQLDTEELGSNESWSSWQAEGKQKEQ